MDERTKQNLARWAKIIIDSSDLENGEAASATAEFIKVCTDNPEGVKALYTEPQYNGDDIKSAVKKLTGGSEDPSEAWLHDVETSLSSDPESDDGSVDSPEEMSLPREEDAPSGASSGTDSTSKSIESSDSSGGETSTSSVPTAESTPPESVETSDAAETPAVASIPSVTDILGYLKSEGIDDPEDIAKFYKSAAILGFTPDKAIAMAGESTDPKETEKMARRAIRFIKQATALSGDDANRIRNLIKDAANRSNSAEDFQDNLVELSSKEGNSPLADFLSGFAIQEATGLDAETSQSVGEMLNKFGLTPKFATDIVKGTWNLGKELFFTKAKNYTKDTPLYDQTFARILAPYRKKAIGDLETRQTEAGIQNVKKLFGLNDEDAEKWHSFLTDPTLRGMTDQALQMAFMKMGDQDLSKYSLFMKNKDALLDGFAGDGVGYYDSMARGVNDIGAMKQLGQAASLASMGPTLANRWMRADDMDSAYGIMRDSGFNVEDFVVRGSNDIRNVLNGMGKGELEDFNNQFANEYAAKKLSDVVVEGFVDDNEERRKLIDEYLKSDNIDRKREIADMLGQTPESLSSDYEEFKTTALESAKNVSLDTFDPAKAEGLEKEYINRLGGYNINKQIAPVRNAIQSVKTFMNLVPGAAKLNGGKPIDDRKANELIRAIGGNDYSGDYEDYGNRVIHVAQIAARNNIPLDRAISAVAESGKMLQQIGLSTRLTQAVGEAGMTAFDAAYRASGGMVDTDRLLAKSMQDAANVENSEINRNLVWLVANAENPKLSPKLKGLAQKAKTGNLSQSELRELSNTENLRQESSMTGEQWEASRSTFESDMSRMDAETALNIRLQAREYNQMELIDTLNTDRYKDEWMSIVTNDEARMAGYAGDKGAEELNDANRFLMQAGLSANRRAEILSGKRGFTDKEIEELKKYGKEQGKEDLVNNIIYRAGNVNGGADSDYVFKKLMAAEDMVAKDVLKSKDATASDFDGSMARKDNERVMADRRRAYYTNRAPIDVNETLMEQAIQSDKTGSSWLAEMIRVGFGGHYDQTKAKETLKDYGMGMILSNALNGGSADKFFKLVLGEDNTEEARNRMKAEAGYGDMSDEKFYTELMSKNGEEINAIGQSMVKEDDSTGKLMLDRLAATTEEELNEANEKFSDYVRGERIEYPDMESPAESPEEGETGAPEGDTYPESGAATDSGSPAESAPGTDPSSSTASTKGKPTGTKLSSQVASAPSSPVPVFSVDSEKTKNVHVTNFNDIVV